MCCAIKAVLKFVISTINVILGIAFLLVALFGVLLKTPVGEQILNTALTHVGEIDNEEAKALADFVLASPGSASVILIAVGLVMAAVCFVGAFASCCGCGLLLKIYAIILAILLLAQIIVLAILAAKPETHKEETCCGINGVNDFKTITSFTKPPAPCCPEGKTDCTFEEASKEGVAVPGCDEKIAKAFTRPVKICMGIAIVIQASLCFIN
ncbi:unnamed protein product [Dibothriocephalus latus]|uniref:Tetraspanin n=1 Tax=Dibothriocephalus latus TaxID=60516 RepID=A0A3P6TBE2_DIBLA|nr:unnamed protein product [Dibothriocephalus latus]